MESMIGAALIIGTPIMFGIVIGFDLGREEDEQWHEKTYGSIFILTFLAYYFGVVMWQPAQHAALELPLDSAALYAFIMLLVFVALSGVMSLISRIFFSFYNKPTRRDMAHVEPFR